MSDKDLSQLFASAPEKAEEVLLEIVEKNPNDSQSYLMLGITRLKLRRYSEGAASFRDALRADPDNRLAQVMLATALQFANDLPNALAAWQMVAKADTGSIDAHAHVALLADVTGQSDLALDARRQLVQLRPDDVAIVADLAVYLSRANKHAEALRMFERVNALDPGFIGTHLVEESAYQASKDATG